jgi:hypothetical protein
MRPEGTRPPRTSPGKISRMADAVSWLMIRPGWKVYASDGVEVGKVDQVAGDDNADIFGGLAIATSALAKPKYVPAESVGPITEGRVELTLTKEQVDALGEFLEPATSAEIEPDDHRGMGERLGAEVRELEGEAMHPVEHQRPVGLVRRIYLLLRRTLGR